MKLSRTYIDTARLVDVIVGALPKNTKVGFAYDEQNTPYVGFVVTDRETQNCREFGKDGMFTGINWRKAK